MKKYFLFLFVLPLISNGQSIVTDSALIAQSNVIRNETNPGGNTKVRIADMFLTIINSKMNKSYLNGDRGPITVSNNGLTWDLDNMSIVDADINSVSWSKITETPTTLSGYGITDASPVLTASNGITKNGNNFEVGGELLNDTTLIYGDPYTTGSSEIPRRLIFKDTDVAFKTSYNDGIDSVLLLMSFIGPAQDVNQNGIFIRAKVSDSDFRETGFLLTKDAITLASGTSNEGEGTFVSVEGNALLVSNTVGTGAYLSVGANSTLLSSGNTSINMQDGFYVMTSTNSGASPSATYQQLFTGSQSSLSLTRSNGSQTIGFGGSGITLGTDTDGTPQTRLTIANNGVLTLQNALTATNGGTGQSNVTTGDMLYGSGSNTWGKVGIGSAGQFLSVSGGVPAWSSLTASNGITKSGNNFSWGGGLTSPVNIFGAQNVVIGGGPSVEGFSVFSQINDGSATIDLQENFSIYGHAGLTGSSELGMSETSATLTVFGSNNTDVAVTDGRIQLKQGGLVPGTAFVGIQPAAANVDAFAVYEDGNSQIFAVGETDGNRFVRLNFGSDAPGDLTYRNSSNNYTRLGIGSNGQVLTVSGGLPAWADGVLKGTSTLDFSDTPSLGQAELTISVTGAAVGDPVSVGTPSSPAAGVFTAYVSATNTVTVRYSNTTGSNVDPASGSYTVGVIKR